MAEYNEEGKMVFTKICPNCRKSFKTTSRHQKYCCPECGGKHNKRKKARRKAYSETRDLQLLVNEAYRFSHKVADMFLDKPEGVEDKDLELHHLDLNPFDCSPSNLIWLKRTDHAKIHGNLPDVNSVETLKWIQANPEDVALMKEELIEKYMKERLEHDLFVLCGQKAHASLDKKQ